MDALRQYDIAWSRGTTPAEKLKQTIELMEIGLRLKREALRREMPNASTEEIDRAYWAWLLEND